MTVRLSPAKSTRAPCELACRPSPAFMTPALAISSLNFIIASSSSGLGMTPASESFVAFTITMNLIFDFLLEMSVSICESNGKRLDRDLCDSFCLPQSQGGARGILDDAEPAHVRHFNRVLHNPGPELSGLLCGR